MRVCVQELFFILNFQSSDAALPRTPTGKRPFAQLQNQNQAELLSPLPQSPQRVTLTNHSPKHSSGHSSKFNLDTPPAKKKMAEKKKERTKTEAKDEKKKSKRVDNKRSKETESDKSQTKIMNFFSPPSKKKKLPEIPCEFSPVKNPVVKVMKQAIDIKSPTWDSPMPLVRKTSTETWDESQDEETPEIVGIVDTSKAVNLARSPVKHSTPMRNHCKEEDIEISRLFPDPGKN
jgi:hypothetical protein